MKRLLAALGMVTILAAIGGGALFVRDLHQEVTDLRGALSQQQRVAGLMAARVDGVESRVDELASQVGFSSDFSSIETRLNGLDRKVLALEFGVGNVDRRLSSCVRSMQSALDSQYFRVIIC